MSGAETENTTKKVSKKSGTSKDNTAQILTAAAPLLMSVLGQENNKSSKKSSKKASNDLVGALLASAIENVNVTDLLMGALTESLTSSADEKKTSKKTTTKKSTTAKSTTKKKAASTTKKKAASTTKKKAADDGIDVGDVAKLLTTLDLELLFCKVAKIYFLQTKKFAIF